MAVALAVVLAAMPSLPGSEASDVEYDQVFEIYGTTVKFVFTGGEAKTIEWDFGDGYTSTAWDPQHTYTERGTYTVTQTVYNTYQGGSYSTAYYKVIIHGPPWITFESNGGTPVDTITMPYGGQAASAASKPTDPTKEGFTFAGWYTDTTLTDEYDWSTKVTVPVSLYAKWDPIVEETFTITLISEDTTYTSFEVASGTAAQMPAGPDRDGYRLIGWYSDTSLTTPYDWSAPVTSDITLYAKWQEIVLHEVTFEGTDIPSQDIESGDTAVRPQDPLRVGYAFGGWYTDSAYTIAYDWSAPVTQDITLYPKWTVLTFEVTFEGTDIPSTTVEYDHRITKPTDPSREGFTFGGWYSDRACTLPFDWSTPIVADTVVYAKWTAVTYTVTFDGADIGPITVDHGTVVTEPTDPVRDGYTFDGWYTDSARTVPYDWSAPVTSDIMLYAKWTPVSSPGPGPGPDVKEYTVRFDSMGGSSVRSQTIESEDTATKPADPIRDGYTFDGWYTDRACTDAYDWSTKVTRNITLYAGWTEAPVTYTITFSGADVAPITVEEGSTASRPADPTRDGFVFVGWFTDASFTRAYDWSTPVTSDMTLYAKWTETTSPDDPVIPDEPTVPGDIIVNPDGSSSETTRNEVTNADGSITTTESTTNRDQSGNIIGSTVTESTSSTVVDQTTGAVTETTTEKVTTTDKDGNESMVESTTEKVNETKVDQTTGAKVETTTERVTVKDEAGVEITTETRTETTSSTTVDEETGARTDTVVESVTKTDRDGNTSTTETVKETTSSSTIDETTGAVVDTTSEKVTITDENGKVSTTERTESVKDYVTEDGTEVNETVTTDKAANGSSVEAIKETTVSFDGNTRVDETIVTKDPSGKVTGSINRTELSDTEEYVITTVEIHTDHNDDVMHVDSLTTVKVEGGLMDEHIATAIEHAILIDAKVDEHGATNVHSVLLDASSSGSGTLTVPTHTIDAIAGTGSDVSIKTSEGTVQMSKGVTDNLSGSASVKVSISKHTHDDFEGDRKEILRDRHIVSFGLSRDGQDVHELGGKVTASFSYQPKPGQAFSDLRMYYIDENNLTHLMESYFDATTRQMVMDSDHFSVFFVGLLSEEGNGTGYVEPEDDTMLYVAIGAVAAVILIAAIVLLRRRA